MKRFFLLAAFAATAAASRAQTQVVINADSAIVIVNTDTTAEKGKKSYSLSIGSNGVEVTREDTGKKVEPRFNLQYGMVDLGFNRIHNAGPELGLYLPAPAVEPPDAGGGLDGMLLPLREGKSINVNVFPLMMRFRLSAAKRPTQNFYLTSGIGLQMYNFRFSSSWNYVDDPVVGLQDFTSLNLRKNKLGFTFLSVPLSILAKTKLAPKATLVYGVGVMGGYRLASWTKLKTGDGDKRKNHDDFNFRDFNACLTGEVGLDDYVRLYATYQLTPLHDETSVLDQRPFCIGVRFLGL